MDSASRTRLLNETSPKILEHSIGLFENPTYIFRFHGDRFSAPIQQLEKRKFGRVVLDEHTKHRENGLC